jgi:hypothetical protein
MNNPIISPITTPMIVPAASIFFSLVVISTSQLVALSLETTSEEASGETSSANCTNKGVDRFTAKWWGENWLLLVGPLGFEPRTYGL